MNSLTFAAALAFGTIAWADGPTTPPAQNTAPAKKATVSAAVRKAPATPAATPAATKKSVANSAAAKHVVKKTPVVRTTWRNRQSAPTPDRYREIQQALAAKGYLSAEEANGAWGASSTDALKKFQAEQSLESTGRIDSLSLIALGLGPKHDPVAPRVVVVDGNFQLESGRN